MAIGDFRWMGSIGWTHFWLGGTELVVGELGQQWGRRLQGERTSARTSLRTREIVPL